MIIFLIFNFIIFIIKYLDYFHFHFLFVAEFLTETSRKFEFFTLKFTAPKQIIVVFLLCTKFFVFTNNILYMSKLSQQSFCAILYFLILRKHEKKSMRGYNVT